jgi:hypothetical protein
LTVRLSVGCATCADFANLRQILEDFGLPEQEVPAELLRHSGESLDAWRDRLYHVFRIPTLLASLADVKLSYVEQVAPLLAQGILVRVREEPDELRLDKTLFRQIVDEISPPIPYAQRSAIADRRDLLHRDDVVALMRSRLSSDRAVDLLGEPFLRYVLEGIRTAGARPKGRVARFKAAIKALVPRSVKNRLWDTVAAPKVVGNVLAFRVYVMLRMHEVLSSDSGGCES